jgi:hypothetical protein
MTSNPAYYISQVLIDGEINEATGSITFDNITEDHTVIFVFSINTYTITATASENGSITSEGETTVTFNDSKTYTITPYEGYHIDKVLIDGENNLYAVSSGSYTFENVIENHTITASFLINTYTVTIYTDYGNGLELYGQSLVNHGTSYVISMTFNPVYNISQILINGTDMGGINGSFVLENITKDIEVIVVYAINTYTITATASANGSITPEGASEVNHGDSPTYTIKPDTGYHIFEAFIDGVNNPEAILSGSHTFENVIKEHTIIVTFAINTYTISAIAGDNGFITSEGETEVKYNDTQTYMFSPDLGYHIFEVLIDGINNSDAVISGSYIFENIDDNHTIEVSFAINAYTITVQANEGGDVKIEIDGEQHNGENIPYGTNLTVIATSQEGYDFSNWTDNTGIVSLNEHYSFDVTVDISLTANFTKSDVNIDFENSENDLIKIISKNKKIIIDVNLIQNKNNLAYELFDMNGRLINKGLLTTESENIIEVFSTVVYLLNVKNSEIVKNYKIIIK